MSDYEAVVANTLASSAVWSGDRLNVTACSLRVVRDLVPRIEEDTRRKHRQELIEELLRDSDDYSFDFCQSWLRSKLEEAE